MLFWCLVIVFRWLCAPSDIHLDPASGITSFLSDKRIVGQWIWDFSKTLICFFKYLFHQGYQWLIMRCLKMKCLRMIQLCKSPSFYLYGVCVLLQIYYKYRPPPPKECLYLSLRGLGAWCHSGSSYGTQQFKVCFLPSSWKCTFNFTFYWNVTCNKINNS